jgi:hypothetical protein
MASDSKMTDVSTSEPGKVRRLGNRARLGIALIILSFVVWIMIFVVPFLPLTRGAKWTVGLVLWLGSYACWFLGLYLAGREVAGPIVNWLWKWVPWRKDVKEDTGSG